MKKAIQKLSLLCAILGTLSVPATAEISAFTIDKDHSTIEFAVKHLTISSTRGSFSNYDGTINWSGKEKEASFEGTIKIDSINTKNDKRDAHLKSADFFESAKYPEMKFKSKSIKKSGKNYTLTGDLTIKNVTKTITMPLAVSAVVKDPWGNDRISFNTTFKINRQDYGLNFNKVLDNGGLMVGNDVTITIDIEAIRQKNTEKLVNDANKAIKNAKIETEKAAKDVKKALAKIKN